MREHERTSPHDRRVPHPTVLPLHDAAEDYPVTLKIGGDSR
jgi:hypothetical protein